MTEEDYSDALKPENIISEYELAAVASSLAVGQLQWFVGISSHLAWLGWQPSLKGMYHAMQSTKDSISQLQQAIEQQGYLLAQFQQAMNAFAFGKQGKRLKAHHKAVVLALKRQLDAVTSEDFREYSRAAELHAQLRACNMARRGSSQLQSLEQEMHRWQQQLQHDQDQLDECKFALRPKQRRSMTSAEWQAAESTVSGGAVLCQQ